MHGCKYAPISIFAPEFDGPALVHLSTPAATGLRFVGLIMPMRDKDPKELKTVPAWLAAPEHAAPAKAKRAKSAPTSATPKAA